MPIKQAEMKAIADAAGRLRDAYLADMGQLEILRTMYAESGQQVHLDAMLEALDRAIWSAPGACAQHMLPVEVYLERYRLTASANAANAERKRRARARARGETGGAGAQQHAERTNLHMLTRDEQLALDEWNSGQRGDVPSETTLPPAQSPSPGMVDLPDLGEMDEDEEEI